MITYAKELKDMLKSISAKPSVGKRLSVRMLPKVGDIYSKAESYIKPLSDIQLETLMSLSRNRAKYVLISKRGVEFAVVSY